MIYISMKSGAAASNGVETNKLNRDETQKSKLITMTELFHECCLRLFDIRGELRRLFAKGFVVFNFHYIRESFTQYFIYENKIAPRLSLYL